MALMDELIVGPKTPNLLHLLQMLAALKSAILATNGHLVNPQED